MKKKILLIEDDKNLSEILKLQLEDNDYEVVVAENGKVGLDIAITTQQDLILLDIQLPILDGYDVLLNLKSDNITKNIPVIVLTNLGYEENKEKLSGLDIQGYFIKSNIDFKEILEKINGIIHNA